MRRSGNPPLRLLLFMVTNVTGESSQILNLLSSMFLLKPTKEALENWKALLAGDTSDFLLPIKDAVNKINLNSTEALEDLLWEYTRLFIGPYKLPCPPWESVYTSGKKLMMQEAFAEVQDFYEEAGLTLGDANIMADHVGAELNFLAVLYEKINNEPEKKSYYTDMADKFLQEHLQKWIPQFTADLEKAADSEFYKALAQVTRNVITAENN